MNTPQWWHWQAAVARSVATPGVLATAMLWAGACWSWTAGAGQPTGVTLAQLRERYPAAPNERGMRKHFADLVQLGLLAPAKHGRERAYVPVIPSETGTVVPLSAGNTGTHVPVTSSDTGTPVPKYRHSGAAAPFSSEVTDPPTHARTHAYAREDTRTRGENDQHGQEAYAAVVAALDSRHGHGTSDRIAPGYRGRLVRELGALVAAGWPVHVIADRISEGNLRGVGKVGGVLVSRALDLAQQVPPKTAAARAAERRASQPDLRPVAPVVASDSPQVSAALAEAREAMRRGDGLSPPGFTPSLIPEADTPDTTPERNPA